MIENNSINNALVVGSIHADLDSLNYAQKLRENLGAKHLILLGYYVD